MSSVDIFYLGLVLVAFIGFAVALAYTRTGSAGAGGAESRQSRNQTCRFPRLNRASGFWRLVSGSLRTGSCLR